MVFPTYTSHCQQYLPWVIYKLLSNSQNFLVSQHPELDSFPSFFHCGWRNRWSQTFERPLKVCMMGESLWGERRDCRVEKQKRFLVKWLCTEVISSCDNSVQACKKRGLAACHITGLVTGKEWWFLKTGLRVCPASSKCCQEISLPIKHPWATEGASKSACTPPGERHRKKVSTP